eukprot:3437059-Rhodomonas_salina.3
MSGTDAAYGGMRLRACHAMSGADITCVLGSGARGGADPAAADTPRYCISDIAYARASRSPVLMRTASVPGDVNFKIEITALQTLGDFIALLGQECRPFSRALLQQLVRCSAICYAMLRAYDAIGYARTMLSATLSNARVLHYRLPKARYCATRYCAGYCAGYCAVLRGPERYYAVLSDGAVCTAGGEARGQQDASAAGERESDSDVDADAWARSGAPEPGQRRGAARELAGARRGADAGDDRGVDFPGQSAPDGDFGRGVPRVPGRPEAQSQVHGD